MTRDPRKQTPCEMNETRETENSCRYNWFATDNNKSINEFYISIRFSISRLTFCLHYIVG